MNFYDDPRFQQTAMEATRRANHTGERQRIFRAYGAYCVKTAGSEYVGEHVAYVEPDSVRAAGRVLNESRKAQGFKSQAQLDGFFAHYDHQKNCAECQRPGPMLALDDGMQPTMNECAVSKELLKAYWRT